MNSILDDVNNGLSNSSRNMRMQNPIGLRDDLVF